MRHAQEYWLKKQAEEAVKRANSTEWVPTLHVHPIPSDVEELKSFAAERRDRVLDTCAKYLIEAEHWHRLSSGVVYKPFEVDHWQCLECPKTFDKEIAICSECGCEFIQPVLKTDLESKND